MVERVTMEAPETVSFTGEEMSQEREALLLECGEYPDKGLTVTEADLDGIVARFGADGAPIKVEHMDTALDPLGRVRQVWRDGAALRAKLVFPEDLAAFLRRRGVQKLSVGLAREAVGLALAEVSLVLKPRVASATMFGEEEPTPAQAPTLAQEPTPAQAPTLPKREGGAVGCEGLGQVLEGGIAMAEEAKEAEIGRLSAKLTALEVDSQIMALKAQGRVVPATEPMARALLSVPPSSLITLAEGENPVPVSQAFLSYLQAQPPVIEFQETAGGESGKRSHHHPEGDLKTLTPEEEAFLKKLEVDPKAVQHMMRHGSLPNGPMGVKG